MARRAPVAPAGPRPSSTPLPPRPLVDTPERLQPPDVVVAQQRRWSRQPWLGLAGLLFVVPIAVLLAVGAGGPERTALIFGPLITFALPVIAVVAFWWDDWPGTMLRPEWWTGWFDTLVIAVLAIVLTVLGQAVVARIDLSVLFNPYPGIGHTATSPTLLPLGATVFMVMLQYTLVTEGWPLRQLPRVPAGLAALALVWVVAVAVYAVVIRAGLLSEAELGALTILIGVWQVWFFLAWHGWPFALIDRRWVRLSTANAFTLVGGCLTFALTRQFAPVDVSAFGGALIAAGVLISMLFEGALRPYLSPLGDRLLSIVVIAGLGVAIYAGLTALAARWSLPHLEPGAWVTHAALNALTVSVILHTTVGRRWPFGSAPLAR